MNLEHHNTDNQNGNGAPSGAATEQPSTEQLDPRILADLARSDLGDDDARNMHIRPATFSELAPMFGKKMAARAISAPVYFIPYVDLDSAEWGPYGRYKFLDDCGKEAGEDWPKYMSTPGAVRRLYFPVVPGVISAQDWTKVIFSHAELPLYNVESEKAACRIAKESVVVVAGGGCWSHVGKPSGQRLIKDYDRFNFKGREVIELLDSDVADNPAVLAARWDFCYAASERGANPSYITLPHDADGKKQGPDDFAKNKSVMELLALPKEGFDSIKNFWELNKRYAIMTGKPAGRVLDTATGEYLKKADFEIVANKAVAFVPKLTAGKNKDGKSKAKLKWQEVKAGSGWLTWGYRREYTEECFSPGQPRDLADGAYNAWEGFGCESEAGPVTLWTELLDHICADEPPEMRRYLEAWIAYPIQHPGGKNHNAPVLRSTKHGCGKSLAMEICRLIHGMKNSTEVGNEQLFGRFNKWQKNVTFASCEEVSSGADSRSNGRLIKQKITQPTVMIELKGIDSIELPDRCNYMFASNERRPLQIDFEDRRFGVIDIKNKLDPTKGDEISKWAKQSGGIKAIRWHLEHLDIEWYNPHAPAPFNQSKQAVIDDGAGEYDTWASNLLSDEPPSICMIVELVWSAETHIHKTVSRTLVSNVLTGTGKVFLLGRVRCDPKKRNGRVAVYGFTEAWGRRIAEIKQARGRDGWIGQEELHQALFDNSDEREAFFGVKASVVTPKKDKY